MYYIIYIYLAIVTCMLNGMEIKYLTNKKNKKQKTKQKQNKKRWSEDDENDNERTMKMTMKGGCAMM